MVATRPDGDGLVRSGTAASVDRTNGRLFGRERESAEIHGLLSDPHGPRLVLVRGERGVGRGAFVRAVADRLRAQGTVVSSVVCAPGDGERPLLLALRLVMALQEHRSGVARQPAGQLVTRALSAVDRGDRAAMDELLGAALEQSEESEESEQSEQGAPEATGRPVTVLVDDAQHADAESLAVLGRIEVPRLAPEVRLVVSAVRHGEPSAGGADATGRAGGTAGAAEAVERLAGVPGARTVVLSRLGPDDTAALVARRLRATPDAALVRRVCELTRGLPGAVDALLTGWTCRGEIRVADGHAFLLARTPVPVLPDDDRFVTALDALGGPSRAVAAALTVLWPLGRPVREMIAAETGLSAEAVDDGLRGLVEEGIVDELPGPGNTAVRGWTFRLPLTAHTVLERLRPMERSRLSAAAVQALWAAPDAADALLDEADARSYLPDRIADAGILVDRDRAVAELTAAAARIYPDLEGLGMLRWFRAAAQLIERPAARDLALQRYAGAAYVAGDYPTGRTIAEALLRNPGEALTPLALQQTACLLVAATANEMNWPTLSRQATAPWWDELPLPALARVTGQGLALCRLGRWEEALEVFSAAEAVWNTDPHSRAKPEVFSAAAELALGRPERFRRAMVQQKAPELLPDIDYGLAMAMFDELANAWDLNAATALLDSRGLTVDVLPPLSRFLWCHLTGRWDEAMESARRLLANSQVQVPASDSQLLPARTAAILLARGRVTTALRTLESMRGPEGGPPQYSMHLAEAEVLRTLGDLDGAERALHRGLDGAAVRGQVHNTEELWALLAEVRAEAGHTAGAVVCLERLGRIADRTGAGRARLRHLVASALVLRRDDPDTARGHLREAVGLARSRGLPFETATTLVAAAEAGAAPATLLHEAYEIFGAAGAGLWRFHTRTALREAGLTGPGRKQATAENEQLLATLIAEGLTNRQIARVLRLSEDAVAQRLSRLFARTGLRSRTEVVNAVRTGTL
ncbi:AAA family ATPase [Streptomyces sp. NPDC002588]|uniref:AAA family ATPase n=1 Tax=Streptomyces sp. NPDC002588 TaxID=3154419 RepID=UPI003320B008